MSGYIPHNILPCFDIISGEPVIEVKGYNIICLCRKLFPDLFKNYRLSTSADTGYDFNQIIVIETSDF